MIAKSDYILVAAALTKDSQGMVGAAELARVRWKRLSCAHGIDGSF